MTKPWQTVAWKNKRVEYIKGKSCEWCGSKQTLSISHKHHFNKKAEYRKIGKKFVEEYFKNRKNEKEKKELMKKAEKTTKPKYLKACPKCKSSSVYERTTIAPKFRCKSCGHLTDELVERLSSNIIDARTKKVYSLFFKKHRKEINKIFSERWKEFWREYINFKEVWILCKRCHFAQEKGLILCKKCKEQYHKPRHQMCWKCFNKTPMGKRIAREKKLRIYTHPWCGKTFKIERQYWEIVAKPHSCCFDCEINHHKCKTAEKHWMDGT
jgi:hypothetical protein